jgi:hypothetical protein
MPLRSSSPPTSHAADAAEAIALSALAYLLADDERAQRFVQVTNFSDQELKDQLANSAFLGGVLDFILEDETLVDGVAATLGLAPDEIAAARRRLPGAAIMD